MSVSSPVYYYDDPEQGLARETSHPAFVHIATDDFYYDLCDDFSPFGSDDGFDTLQALQDWYQETENAPGSVGPHHTISQFLEQLLESWDMGPTDLIARGPGFWTTWVEEQEMNTIYMACHCRAGIACAFGQLKITGSIDPVTRNQGLAAIEALLWINQRARTLSPDWEYADLERSRLLIMQQALQSLA